MLPQCYPKCYPNYKTVHRRFQAWCHSEVLRRVLTDIANELRTRGVLDEEESFIDATFAMAKGGGADVGPRKRGKGLKIMAIVDRHGLPLSVSTQAANHHEVRLVQLCFDFYMIEAERFIVQRGRTLSAALCLLKLEDPLPIVFHADQYPVVLLRRI